MSELVLTLLGPDRPGLVESVAQTVAAHGGNWLESRMAHLGGQFAGILRIEVPTQGATALRAALADLQGVHVVVAPDAGVGFTGKLQPIDIELIGQDRPGLVREIARVLAGRGANVEDLHTERTSAPMSGETLFRARARVHVAMGTSLDGMRDDLERLAQDLMVEIRVGVTTIAR